MEAKMLTRDPEHTRRQLKSAAQREFNSAGYFFTDTNKIAKAAGYAPGTFYRHYQDKVEVFIEVYRDWHTEQMNAIEKALHEEENVERLNIRSTSVILEFYTRWKTFRASARLLAFSEARVAEFRRVRRIELVHAIIALRQRLNFAPREIHEVVTFLIELERLCDAIADGEYQQFGIPIEISRGEVEQLMSRFLNSAIF